VPRLREDAEEAQLEVNRAQEQEQMKQIEVTELQRQRNELRQQLHEAEEAHRAVSTWHIACLHQRLQQQRHIQAVITAGVCIGELMWSDGPHVTQASQTTSCQLDINRMPKILQ
jgi:flagellar biosynthesis chaperone FliJ